MIEKNGQLDIPNLSITPSRFSKIW